MSRLSANVLDLLLLVAVVVLLLHPRIAGGGAGSLLAHFCVVLHVVFPVDFRFLGVTTGSLLVLEGSGCGAGLIMAYLLTPM